MNRKKPIHTTLSDENFKYIERRKKEENIHANQIIEDLIKFRKKFSNNKYLINKKEKYGFDDTEMLQWMIDTFIKIENNMGKFVLNEVVQIVVDKYMKDYSTFSPMDVMESTALDIINKQN